ncbi:unnamed protein product [Ilex paraguariensis]|uniref:Uncharacterized protein n=1 Tax=Ilex paraguariensis TaxID=185542 RepID=A0ABC8T8M8_9AQUA
MAEKEGGIVKKGHQEGTKMSVALLEEFGLPSGLLPLADVIEVGFVRSTGYMWILQKEESRTQLQMISKLVSYDTEITGYVEKKQIKKLKGVKAKELVLWPPVNQITIDDPPTGKIHFKSLAGITKTFPVEAFAAGLIQWQKTQAWNYTTFLGNGMDNRLLASLRAPRTNSTLQACQIVSRRLISEGKPLVRRCRSASVRKAVVLLVLGNGLLGAVP